MSTAKHTPGPWEYDGPPHNVIVWSSPENRICFMTSDGPTEANARLIAAAPELLEIAKEVKEACLFDDDDGQIGVSEEAVIPFELFNRICRVIKKSSGEQ